MKEEKNNSKEIIRYIFFSEWLEKASKEEIIDKLIQNDERAKLIKELQEQNDELCKMINGLVDKIDEVSKLINENEKTRKTYMFTCVKCGFEWESSSDEIMQCGMCGSGNVLIEDLSEEEK